MTANVARPIVIPDSFSNEHEAFAASRVSQYVYVPTNPLFFSAIDTYVDANEGDIKKPLVILGSEGSGKSALLANWASKRREYKSRNNEFLFQHVVGCSTPSLQLAHTLFRLETELKHYFQLREMKVPDNEEDLRWALNRFLSAAAKKLNGGTITIIIDGVHLIKSSCGPDGVLYWLPTNLPPGVRIILSSIEYSKIQDTHRVNHSKDAQNETCQDQFQSLIAAANSGDLNKNKGSNDNENQTAPNADKNKDFSSMLGLTPTKHPTVVELERRQCGFLSMEPLPMNIIGSIVRTFLARQPPGTRELNDHQIFAIMTCKYSSQPMFLRSLLQSLQLTLAFTSVETDVLVERFLGCTTAHNVIETSLNICYSALMAQEKAEIAKQTHTALTKKHLLKGSSHNMSFNNSSYSLNDPNKENIHNDVSTGALDHRPVVQHTDYRAIATIVFSMVYISRNGLTLDEIWGAVFTYMKIKLDENVKRNILPILTNFTMVVDNMHSFSHELYREVVYSNYIKSKDAVVKLHQSLSRFFTQLPPCDRKLVVLPYHLEAAGSWSKVKNCLTDIELFQKWWRNPKSKVDFIKFWVSLTSFDKNEKVEKGKRPRPSYDIVDEYVKSLDEFKYNKEPSDEELSNIILEIGDFLLEFSTLGHEKNCDVPNFLHPQIPTTDLKNVGVPYLTIDKFGRSVMAYPDVIESLHKNQNAEDDGRDEGDSSNRLLQDIPICNSYFFQRWMWIQYPYIALGNCDARYTKGIELKILENKDYSAPKQSDENEQTQKNLIEMRKKLSSAPASSATFNANAFKLPELSFRRKAARSFRRVPADNGVDSTVVGVDKVTQRLIALQDDILNHKEELDFIVQMKSAKEKKLYQLKGVMVDLERSGESSAESKHAVEEAQRLEQEAEKKVKSVTRLNSNLQNLRTMCNRHPANVPALLEELQIKVDADKFLLAEIKKRLFEQNFEKQMHDVYFKQMKLLVEDGLQMHNQLLTYRYMMKKDIQLQQIDMEKRLSSNRQEKHLLLTNGPSSKKSESFIQIRNIEESSIDSMSVAGRDWKEQWDMISSRTGIIEPEVFFDRINNGNVLESQISALRSASEGRLEHLKREFIEVEAELQDISSAFQNGASMDAENEAMKSKDVISGSAKDQARVNIKEKKIALDELVAKTKHQKEKTENAEQMKKKVESGLIHIAAMVGIPPVPEEDCCATQLLNEIETMLETLMSESERRIQQMLMSSQSASSSSQDTGPIKPASPEKQSEPVHRSPEFDYIIAKFEDPKARLPKVLPSRSLDEEAEKASKAVDNDDSFDDELMDRHFIKNSASKVLRMEQKKQEKMLKDKEKNKSNE